MSGDLPKIKLSVRKGASADIPLRLETGTLSFAAISAMAKSAPLRVAATGHNIPDGWYVAIVDAKGMTELNATDSNAIRDNEFHRITWVDADTVDFDGISSANFKTYTSGGYLAFYAPMSLTSYTSARMDVKTRIGGDVILALNTTDGTLELDDVTSTVWIRLEDDRGRPVDRPRYRAIGRVAGAAFELHALHIGAQQRFIGLRAPRVCGRLSSH